LREERGTPERIECRLFFVLRERAPLARVRELGLHGPTLRLDGDLRLPEHPAPFVDAEPLTALLGDPHLPEQKGPPNRTLDGGPGGKPALDGLPPGRERLLRPEDGDVHGERSERDACDESEDSECETHDRDAVRARLRRGRAVWG